MLAAIVVVVTKKMKLNDLVSILGGSKLKL